jgi:hypothetical protein
VDLLCAVDKRHQHQQPSGRMTYISYIPSSSNTFNATTTTATAKTVTMDPSTTMNLIDFAKGRQETLDLTVPLKEISSSSAKEAEGGDGISRKGKRDPPRRRNSEDQPLGSLDAPRVEDELRHPRRRSSIGQSISRSDKRLVYSERDAQHSPRREERISRRRSSMEHTSEKNKQRFEHGGRDPPKRVQSVEALSTSRRKRGDSSRNLMSKTTAERSQSSRNLSLGKPSTERSQSSRNLSVGRKPARSQSARNLDLSRKTTERSRSDRNLGLTRTNDDGSGSGSGERREKSSRSSRRPREDSNTSTESASSSSKSQSRSSKAPLGKSKSLRSFSLKDEIVDQQLVPTKSSFRSSSKLSPKSSRKDLRENKHSSSQSLRELKTSSSRSLLSKKAGTNSNSSSRRKEQPVAKSSPIKESRSPTTPGASPKVTTGSLRQEMKDTLKAFPDLHKGGKSPRPSPKSCRSLMLDNTVKQGFQAAGDNQATASTTSSSSSQKEKSSKNSQRRRSPKSDSTKHEESTRRSSRQKSQRDLSSDDDDSMPALIDDSLQRENLEGKRGEKSWHICEDTPGGHAPEKLTIVEGVEYYADSMDEDEDILDEYDEDDTILQDSVSLARPNRKQILPRDPVQKGQRVASSAQSARPADRFNPSFQNKEMWKSDEFHASEELTMNSFRMREEIDTASELDTTITDHTLTNHTFETYMLEQDCNHQQGKEETPSTLKRAGGRRAEEEKDPSFPGLHKDSKHAAEGGGAVQEDGNRHPSPVPEDDVMGTYDPDSLRKRIKSKSSGGQQNTGSNSTGRSSRRKSSKSHSNRMRSGKRPTKGSGVPSVVPSSPYESSYSLRSPLSSSFASPQTSISITSSSRQNPEFVNLTRPNDHGRNKTLQNYVGRGFSSPRTDDDNTLGASTITTNFSSTQRTFGDNTVSTRSLFRSDVMKGSDMMKIPQRRRDDDSDIEDDDSDNAPKMPGVPSLDAVNAAFDLLQSSDGIAQIAAVMSSEQKFSNGTPRMVLRRPSRESDDFFDELEEMRVSSDQSELDSNEKTPSSRDFDTSIDNTIIDDDGQQQRSSSSSDRFRLTSALNLSSRAGTTTFKKKKSKRNLFQRVQSWKERISAEDEE